MKGNHKNINHLLLNIPHGIVVTSSWLLTNGINHRLQHHYTKKTHLLKRIGVGAYVIEGQDVTVSGALYTLCSQLNINFHVGALSSLENIHKIRHFINFRNDKLQIFFDKNQSIPKWFMKNFGDQCDIYRTQFLSSNSGIKEEIFHGFSLHFSSLERAIIEAIFLSPNKVSIREIAQMMETMTNLRPAVLQELLGNCSSVKAKRIFLHISEKHRHSWFDFLNLQKIDIGSGKRVINSYGKLDKKYQIVIDDLAEI